MPDGTRMRDWVATGAALGASVGVAAVFGALQRAARTAWGERAHQHTICGLATWVTRVGRVAGVRVRCEGLEHATSAAQLVVANHQSVLDLALLVRFLGVRGTRFVAHPGLFRLPPGARYAFERGGSAFLDPNDPRRAVASLENFGAILREGRGSVVVFPERAASTDAMLRPFQAAMLRALCARAPAVPVLPATCSGTWRLASRAYRPLVCGGEVVLRFHRAMRAPDPADPRAFAAFVRALERTVRSALPLAEDLATTEEQTDRLS